ncbi:hypothetical protein KR044_003347 [Drosophila immigrans]|nr:hypothetical protein KR044_003347 [Drosophila immigrans]
MSESRDRIALHLELIEYATVSCRLLFIQDAEILAEFESSNAQNELSTFELNAILLNDVLPKVHSYQLTETVKNRLKLLDLHPGFRKTAQGYQYHPKSGEAPFVLKLGCDFNLTERLPQLLVTDSRREGNSHTMLMEPDGGPFAAPQVQLSLDLGALLSAMVSTDMELSSAQMHSVPEIQRRLRRAKQSFEDTGNLLPFRDDIEQVVNYLDTFDRLKKSLYRVLSHSQ